MAGVLEEADVEALRQNLLRAAKRMTRTHTRRKLTGMTPSSLPRLALAGMVALLVGPLRSPRHPKILAERRSKDMRSRRGLLGVMYRNGEGVPQDDVEAYKWFILATTYADASEHDKNYVCSHFSCQEPVNDPARLDAQLTELGSVTR